MRRARVRLKQVAWSFWPKLLADRERALLGFYSRFIDDGDLCFDVGANVGTMTALFVTLGAKVVAFEPQNACFATLQERYRGFSSVMPLQFAIGATKGSAVLRVCDSDELSSLDEEFVEYYRARTRFGWNHTQQVALTTLDDMIGRFGIPRFCKIDVEGFEPAVLGGLSHPIEAIGFEYHRAFLSRVDQCLSELARIGDYSYNFAVDEAVGLQLGTWIRGRELLARIGAERRNGNIYARLESPS